MTRTPPAASLPEHFPTGSARSAGRDAHTPQHWPTIAARGCTDQRKLVDSSGRKGSSLLRIRLGKSRFQPSPRIWAHDTSPIRISNLLQKPPENRNGEAQSDLSAKAMTFVTGLTGPTVSSARIGQAPFSGHQGGFGRSNHWMVKRRVQMSGCEQRIVFRTVAGMGCPYLSKRQLWKK